ncbi:MAG: hypothetical protein K2K94_10670, partial [Muribaculaceae bacterium]|nr:hypothetical protein [Muribaculaceae bacterium]
NDNEYWFGKQASNKGELTFRMSYSFISHWSIYADLFFGSGTRWTPPPILDWEYDFVCGISFSAGIGAGAMYHITHGRWQLFTRAGIGKSSSTTTNYVYRIGGEDYEHDENNKYREAMHAYLWYSPSYVNFGITGGYRLSHFWSLILDLNYRYPYTSSKVQITRETDIVNKQPEVLDRENHYSRSWGNNLTISIGFQLQCELSKR